MVQSAAEEKKGVEACFCVVNAIVSKRWTASTQGC